MDLDLPQLVRRATHRDAAAFAELIGRFERTALALALAGTGDAHAAGDVVQDAFVRAWQRLGSLNDPARFGPWLAGIVRNLAADFRRSGRRLRSREDLDAVAPTLASHDDPASRLHLDETKRLISQAIESLDEVSRSAVVLRYYEGLTSRRIAELLELSPAAIDMRLMRAREHLRQRLAPHAPAGASAGSPVHAVASHSPEEYSRLAPQRVGGTL